MSVTTADLDAFRESLVAGSAPLSGDSDEALQLIRALEECKNAATAAQARLAVVVHDAQRAADADRGIKPNETARAVGWQLGLARRQGPRKGRTFLGFARAVVTELPHTHDALCEGRIGEWQATQVVAATSFLSLEGRKRVDDEVTELLGTVSDRRLMAAAKASAYRHDPEAFVARRAKAESERRVSLRPTEDCMTLLTALLPVKDGVACLAALQGALRARRPDDQRGRGQLLADTLVERITGRPASTAPQPTASESEATATTMPPPVAINLLVPLESLTGDAEAQLAEFGPIPAELARELVAENEAAGGSLRRVFTARQGTSRRLDHRRRNSHHRPGRRSRGDQPATHATGPSGQCLRRSQLQQTDHVRHGR